MPVPLQSERGQYRATGTQYPRGVMASRGGGHRGLRPDHADQGMARELGRASSASCLENADHKRGKLSGSPPRHQSSHLRRDL